MLPEPILYFLLFLLLFLVVFLALFAYSYRSKLLQTFKNDEDLSQDISSYKSLYSFNNYIKDDVNFINIMLKYAKIKMVK